jgi:thiamine-phosphate pyrophosphorylase
LAPAEKHRIRRVLDANLNRANEGLRVVEDFARFVLDDKHLSRLTKQLRHDLAAAAARIGDRELRTARNTPRDVGTAISTDREYSRGDLSDLVEANHKRVEQSLRCLEEYAKLVAPGETAALFEQLRYRIYTLAQAVETTARNCRQLERAQLYVLIDGGSGEVEYENRVRTLISADVDVIQLRDKRIDDRDLLARARLLWRLTRGTAVRAIINDRPDIAALANADGVHVGQHELSVGDARAVVGPRKLVGVSTHSIEQARQAVLDGADYIGCGPTFPSRTKVFDDFPGLEFLRQVSAEISLPAFAIGGITLESLPNVLSTGFQRVAVGAAVAIAEDPADQVLQFKSLLGADGE